MLEIRNVTKIYTSKAGNSVKALDNVSITFPETGMVFILGKSGSGKSTLLNVIGGLDGCDNGEFIIKGKSSKHFGGSDFDAYRNTFIGFIFQEYNILDDFTVGANIGLALELQGKKATNEKINAILSEVDLTNYAKRKPNELSGGQKQRVAIARALVKDPEIIMADEPTGALDSNTGKQILETLKNLSKTKLVIVVSHDREFAERYADRIIEMKDGQIASDVTKHEVDATPMSSGMLKMTDKLLRIEKGYQLTPHDVALINEYLRHQETDILVSGDTRLNDNVRAAAGITENNTASVFDKTDEKLDVKTREWDGKATKFIRSSLPMKNAIKMGSSGLGHKKFRLVMTIFLSLVAFTMFGFADTLGAYQKVVAATDSIMDSHVTNASFSLDLKHTWTNSDGSSHSYYNVTCMNEEDIKNISDRTGIDFIPVFNGSESPDWSNISVTRNMLNLEGIGGSGSAYSGSLYGLTTLTRHDLNDLGYDIMGRLPSADDEIAISEFMYRQFNHTGFVNDDYNESVKAESLTMNASGKNSIIGKHLRVEMNGQSFTYRITGVIDTGFEYDRYASFIPSENNVPDGNENALVEMMMQLELQNTLRYGFHALGYLTDDALNDMAANMHGSMSFIGTYMNWNAQLMMEYDGGDPGHITHLDRVASSDSLSAVGDIEWLDGKDRKTLGKNEMVISSGVLNYIGQGSDIRPYINEILEDQFDGWWSSDYENNDVYEAIRLAAIEKHIHDDTHFYAMRDELQLTYNRSQGYPDWEAADIYVDDDTLRDCWRNCLLYDQGWLTDGYAYYESVVAPEYRAFVEEITGLDFTDNLPDGFYSNLVSNYFQGMPECWFEQWRATELLIYVYAFEEAYVDDSIIDDKDFFELLAQNRYSKEDWFNLSDEDRRYVGADIYYQHILNETYDMTENLMGGMTRSDFESDGKALFLALCGSDMSDLLENLFLQTSTWDYETGNESITTHKKYKVVGIFEDDNGDNNSLVISDTLFEEHEAWAAEQNYSTETVAPHEAGIYAFCIAPMPTNRDDIRRLVEISYEEDVDLRFSLQNQVMNTLGSFNEFIEVGAQVFLYVGIGFAVFASLMLMNFISVSISYKRREIGILRAVGARSSDVFKIFFSEAAIIALINYVLSLMATIAVTTLFNNIVRSEGLNVTLLNFGIRQVILMLIISLGVAAIASFLPVWNIARRKPVDAIKNK